MNQLVYTYDDHKHKDIWASDKVYMYSKETDPYSKEIDVFSQFPCQFCWSDGVHLWWLHAQMCVNKWMEYAFVSFLPTH